MDITYAGEDLWAGVLGQLLVALSFSTALLSAFSYFKSASLPDQTFDPWKKIARSAFVVHGLSALGAILLLFGLIVTNQFEYHYVWSHSSTELPFRYVFSSFWEGQEGSFMLWLFWQVVLGLILLRTSKKWESPVMVFFAVVQAFITSMLLGVYIGDLKFGSDPFQLLREHPEMQGLPFLANENYLSMIDGQGLNPLLQNYWMTIHPPTLFFGFALTLVPFAYSMAGLWKRDWSGWLKPALPWAFFGVMILGTGILMGGAWAYEALSFGGFWAWDPVENASLVPWLTLVGGAHIMLIRNNKGGSLFSAFLLPIITYILVLYSTFLTRSGVLGDTSVHAFVARDQDWHLLSILLLLLGWGVYLLVSRKKAMPSDKNEEQLYSREFWMFIGALVLMISAFQIIVYTSVPVYNKVFGTNIAPPTDPIEVYNAWQIPFAIVVSLLIAAGQFLNYKKTQSHIFFRKLGLAAGIAIVMTLIIAVTMSFRQLSLILLLFASLFAFFANMDYLIRILKGRIRFAGGSLAHAGFALILLGAVISFSKSEVISRNTSGIDVSMLSNDFNNNEYLMLLKGDTVTMGDYQVTYTGKRKEGYNYFFAVDYKKPGDESASFTLEPVIQINPRMGNVAEPDTRHFLHKDIYTHISSTNMVLLRDSIDPEAYDAERESRVHIGDTLTLSGSRLVIKDVTTRVDTTGLNLGANEFAAAVSLDVLRFDEGALPVQAMFLLKGSQIIPIPLEVPEAGLKVLFTKVDPETGEITLRTSEKFGFIMDFIVLKAIQFPWINLLWVGCLLMVIGTIVALRQRLKRK